MTSTFCGRPRRQLRATLVPTLIAGALACTSLNALAGETTLSWTPSPDPRVAGYTVHWGTSSGNYSSRVNIGNRNSYTISNLPDGQRYYFAVTAHDANGAASTFTNEVSELHSPPAATAPVPSFTASPLSGAPPLKVDFTSTTTGTVTSYKWDFGDGNSALVSGTPPAKTASHTYTTAGTYTARLTASGPGGSATSSRTVTVSVPSATTTTLFGTSTPRVANNADSAAVTLGVRFSSTQSGRITGIRFYKGHYNTGTHTGQLWSASGKLLASGTFTNETASGWQVLRFSTPVAITANTTYVASYHAPRGRYAGDNGYFTTSRVSGPLRAPASTSAAPNGVYAYGSSPRFPSSSFRQTNYWVDVLFAPN